MKIKAILRKNNCLAAIREKPTKIIDDAKWNKMDDNAIVDLHLAVTNELLSSVEGKKNSKRNIEYSHKIIRGQLFTQQDFLKRNIYTL